MLIFEKDIKASLEELYDFMSDFSTKISDYYIYNLFCQTKNKIVLYSFDNNSEPDINNCPCGLIYYVDCIGDEVNIYIMFIATKYKFRNLGYASIFIEEFINFIKNKFIHTKSNNGKNYNKVNIVLDSILEAVTFYEHIGFKLIKTDKYNEKFNINKDIKYEHFIMVYELF
jgi:ribosomal protein S18 acetylase RimI-like enzyme